VITLLISPVILLAGNMGTDLDGLVSITYTQPCEVAMSADCHDDVDTCKCSDEMGCHNSLSTSTAATLLSTNLEFSPVTYSSNNYLYQKNLQLLVLTLEIPPPIS